MVFGVKAETSYRFLELPALSLAVDLALARRFA